MATVGIVMGSDSDMPVMSKACEILEQFGIDLISGSYRRIVSPMFFSSMQRPQRKKE